MSSVSKSYPPSINFDSPYLVSGRSRNQAKQDIHDVPLTYNAFQLLPGDPGELCRRWSPPSCLCKRRHPRGILIRYQNHLSWLLFTRRSSGSTQMSSNFFQPLVSLISFFPSRDLILVTPDQTDPRHAPFSRHS